MMRGGLKISKYSATAPRKAIRLSHVRLLRDVSLLTSLETVAKHLRFRCFLSFSSATRIFTQIIGVFLLLWAASPVFAAEFVLSGVIRDVAGQPVIGAEVGVFKGQNVKKPADFISNRTLADGKYQVSLPMGDYWAVAVYRKGGRRFGPLGFGDKHSGDPLEIEGDFRGVIEDFEVMDLRDAAIKAQKKNPDMVRLSGKIVDKKGRPVEMAYVLADKVKRFKNLPRYLSAWTDKSGEYVLFLPNGNFYLGAATGFPPDSAYILTDEVVLDGDRKDVNVLLP